MTRLLILTLLTTWLGTYPLAGRAAGTEVEGLYRALVPVASQAVDERREALNRALIDVLVKVSGLGPERLRGALGGAVDEPVRFVREYRYESLLDAPGRDPAGAGGLGLGVEFDKAAVDRLLRDAGLPVWGRVRPTTLVWLAEEDGGGRRLVGPAERPELWAALERRAAERGIPLVRPLFDIEDQRRLTAADVWGGFADSVGDASARYDSDAVLVGRLSRGAAGLTDSTWTLYRAESEASWRLREGPARLQISRSVDRLADAFADDFAVAAAPASGRRPLELEVLGLGSPEQYARLMTYLAALDNVRDVVPLELAGERLRLRLHAGVAERRLAQTLTLGRVLRPIPGEGAMRFELVP